MTLPRASPRCDRLDGHSCPYDSSAHPHRIAPTDDATYTVTVGDLATRILGPELAKAMDAARALGILEYVDPVRLEIDKLEARSAEMRSDPSPPEGAVERERAAIVAWLRATPGEPGLPWVDMARDIADAIERGKDRGSR